jgi:hypothetical protein
MTAFVDNGSVIVTGSFGLDLSDQDHEHEQLKEAYEPTVSTLFGETAMTLVPLPGSLEIVSVAPICSARSFIPSRPTPPLV